MCAYIVTKALEEELADWLGRGQYVHGGERVGYRNGYDDAQVRTGVGKVAVKKAKVRATAEAYDSRLWPLIKTDAGLQEKVLEMYVRGLSTRDIEELFRDQDGKKLLSRTSVSRITEELWSEYERFCTRDLSGFAVEYLFLDAVYEAVRRESPGCEGILVAWGIVADGRKVLLHMVLGNKESEDAWLQLLRDLVKRGLPVPVLVCSDGAPGLIKATERVFAKSLRQRCLVHKLQNVLSKVPEHLRDEIKSRVRAVYYAGDERIARLLAQRFEEEYKHQTPSAVACFQDDFDACIAYMRCPVAHHRTIRTTNLLERSFLEEKRRTNTIPGFFTEKSTLKLVFATLLRAQSTWRKVKMGEKEQKQLLILRQKLGIVYQPQKCKNKRSVA